MEKTAESPAQQEESKIETPEQQRDNTKLALQNIIMQMEPAIKSTKDRRNVDKLKHMLELYEAHPFWDTQPVPKEYSLGATPVSSHPTIVS